MLKPSSVSWQQVLADLTASLLSKHLTVVNNIQLMHQSHNAKHNYSAQHRKHIIELQSSATAAGVCLYNNNKTELDPVWESAMQAFYSDDTADATLENTLEELTREMSRRVALEVADMM